MGSIGRGAVCVKIELCERTERHVRIYFEKARAPEIRAMLPQRAATVEEAVEDYCNSIKPGSSSFGRTIYADGVYVGDIWCYGLGQGSDPDAMVSYCVFEKSCWNRGIASDALCRFLAEITVRFQLKNIGAFAYAENKASIAVLRKNGFQEQERFVENGIESVYCSLHVCEET